MEALHPNTKKILNRLLPMTLPMAISGFFFKAATMEVASSAGGASGYECESDNGFADTQITGDVTCSFYKPLSSEDKSA